jgi:hypothetical protein
LPISDLFKCRIAGPKLEIGNRQSAIKKPPNFGGSRSASFSSNVILQQIAAAAFQEMPKRLLQNLLSYLIQFVSYAPDPIDFSNRLRHSHQVAS